MSREQALEKIKQPKPFDSSILEEVKKRLGLKDGEFEQIMSLPKKTYRDYKTHKQAFERMRALFWVMYKLNMVPKSFYMKYTKKYDS